MKILTDWLNGNNKNIERNSFTWNMTASLCYSFQSMLLLFIVTRLSNLSIAGFFSITYAVSQMFASVGSYSMRAYQVSDAKNNYSYDIYATSRIISTILMIVLCVGYALIHGYTGEKFWTVIFFLGYRVVDGAEDVLHGEFQKRGRLDVASRIMAVRIILASLLFVICFAGTQNVMWSSLVMMISAMIISLLFNWLMAKEKEVAFHLCFDRVWKLLFVTAPVCIGAFIYNYLNSSPKYAIDACLSSESQAIFNIIFMPVFVVAMLASFVFKPYIHRMGCLWNDKKIKELTVLIFKIAGVILATELLVLAGGFLLGVPILNLVFGVELSQYKAIFMLLLLFGGVSALNAFATVVVTVMRKQNYILIAYILAFVANILFMNRMVSRFELWGASIMYGIGGGIILVIFMTVIGWNLATLGYDMRKK